MIVFVVIFCSPSFLGWYNVKQYKNYRVLEEAVFNKFEALQTCRFCNVAMQPQLLCIQDEFSL